MHIVMKRGFIVLILMSALVSGCAYTNIQRPLGTEFNETELGTKIGRASSRSLLWLVAWGDAGTRAASENGKIKVIRHADYQIYSLLFGLYFEGTTIVYGD